MAQLIQGVVDTQKTSTVSLGSTNAGNDTLIELVIKSNGEDYIFNNPNFELLSKKADNTKTRQLKDITLEEGKIKIKADIQLVLCKGMVTNQLIINDGDKISTVYFYFFVNPSLENEVLEESKDKIESLEKLDQLIGVSFDNLEEYEKRLNAFGISMDTMEESEEKRKANELTRSTNEKARILTEENRVANESARLENENVRTSSEEDRALAEEERITNENNRRLAENTRKSQENARVAAEASRQEIFEENENIRKTQEAKRVKTETARELKFSTWEEREYLRLISEDQRREAEEARAVNETARDKAEKIREQQETNREATYNNFNNAEEERISNENTRKSNEKAREVSENTRNSNELERIEAENARNGRYEQAEKNRNNTFGTNESNRQRNYEESESTRNNSYSSEERLRNNNYADSENTRNNAFNQQEENRQREYTTAERLRVENENLRKSNEVSRGSNEETRNSNELERIEAENTRVENENSRVVAEEERQTGYENFREQFEHIATKVGDETQGLVKDVNDLKNNQGNSITNKKLIAKYVHSSNKVVQPTAFNPSTGIFTCPDHGLTGNEKLMINFNPLNFTTIRVIPYELFLKFDSTTWENFKPVIVDNNSFSLDGYTTFDSSKTGSIDVTKFWFETIGADEISLNNLNLEGIKELEIVTSNTRCCTFGICLNCLNNTIVSPYRLQQIMNKIDLIPFGMEHVFSVKGINLSHVSVTKIKNGYAYTTNTKTYIPIESAKYVDSWNTTNAHFSYIQLINGELSFKNIFKIDVGTRQNIRNGFKVEIYDLGVR